MVTTHTLFCLRGDADEELQAYLCGMLNSYVANYLVRMRVSTHVTVSIVERLPVPVADRDSAGFGLVGGLAQHLARSPGDRDAHARLQAAAARLYGISSEEFAHVLSTFPLVLATERDGARAAFGAGIDAI